MNRSLSTFDNLMESDVNHHQACLIPEPVHMHTNHTKSMNAVRKYVNNFKKDGLRTRPNTPLNIPALIPIRRVSHILPESHINDRATIEMSMNANSDFGHLGLDDKVRNAHAMNHSWALTFIYISLNHLIQNKEIFGKRLKMCKPFKISM